MGRYWLTNLGSPQDKWVLLSMDEYVPLFAFCGWINPYGLAQIVGPMPSAEFNAADFQTLATYELSKRVNPIADALGDVLAGAAESESDSAT